MHCIALHYNALLGTEPRYMYTDLRLLAKPCTLVHLCSKPWFTFQTPHAHSDAMPPQDDREAFEAVQ